MGLKIKFGIPASQVPDLEPGIYVTRPCDGFPVKETPSVESKLIGRLPSGARVKILEVVKTGAWVRGRIENEPCSGWITLVNGKGIQTADLDKEACHCMKGHALKKWTTRICGFPCDGCRNGVMAGTTLWGCRRCNYDLCESCISNQNLPDEADKESGCDSS